MQMINGGLLSLQETPQPVSNDTKPAENTTNPVTNETNGEVKQEN
jgi:hypothetical protein